MHMKGEAQSSNAREYVESLAAKSRHHFASAEARSALRVSAPAAKLTLNRLLKRHVVASPARGFYVIVPPEYRNLGCLPADQFVPALMERLGQPYYAGLLSAAQYHGAAHHRPQEFQVLLGKSRRPIECGSVRVAFIVRKRISEVPLQSFNTPRGPIAVSTPEATALDLVGYHRHSGGLDNVATLLSELAEKLDAEKIAAVAQTAPVPWAQRLGYLLDHVGAGEKTSELESYVHQHVRKTISLLPGAPGGKSSRDQKWKLYINTTVEAEL